MDILSYLLSKKYTDSVVSQIANFEMHVLETLPETGHCNIFYVIPSVDEVNTHDLYIWAANKGTFEKVGTTKADLTNYYNKQEVDSLINSIDVDFTGYATEDWVKAAIKNIDLSGYAEKALLANVATSGSYEDLANKPQLFDGDYNSLKNQPTIPSIEGLATEDYVDEAIANIKSPETDLSNYYNKEEVETLVENIEHPKQTYYLDFTSTVPKQPETLTDEIKEAATQVIAGKQVAIYLRDDKVADSYLNNYGAGTVKLIESDTYYQIDFGRVARSHTVASGITANWDYTYSLLCSKANSSFFQYTATASKQEFVTQSYVTTAIKNITPPTIPTKLSDLTNDVPYATEQYVTDAIAAIQEPVEEVKSTLNTTVLPKVEKVDEIVPVVETLKTTAATQEWVESKNYTTEAKVIELLENNAGAKIGIDFVTDITVGHLAAGTEIKAEMTFGQLVYRMLFAGAQPEEPEEPVGIKYLSGTFGNSDDEIQEWPEPWIADWSEAEQAEISTHYVNNMIENTVASEEDLVGRHGFAITTPFVKESQSLANYGDTSTDPYTTRPAIVLPIGYQVTAWNTDPDNSSLSECTLYSYALTDGRTVYYAADFPQQTGTTVTHYLTIVKN